MNYIKQLDSLRAIAVILVIISHWLPGDALINRPPNGIIGVDIFFVLSGFLISKILFNNRIKAEQLQTPKLTVIKNFYIRRSLRIFPIYYLVIFLLLMFAGSTQTNIKGAFFYYFTYTSNIYFFKIKTWDGMLSHLWSLGVEEQFYIIFPWIILLIKKKYLLPMIILFIITGIAGQCLMRNIKMNEILTFNCFDAFGMGALFAWQASFHAKKIKRFYVIISIVAVVAFSLFITGLLQHGWNYIPYRILISVMALWLIVYLVLNNNSKNLKLKFIWNNTMLIFLGKISYGIYLYHNIIPHILNQKIINVYLNPLLPDYFYKQHWDALYLIENSILLVLISWLSYVLIEKRFLNIKKYFGYQNRRGFENVTAQLVSS